MDLEGKEIRGRKCVIIDEELSAFRDFCEYEGHKHSSDREELGEIWEQDQHSQKWNRVSKSSWLASEDKIEHIV